MNIKIYQTVYLPEQYAKLDTNCIPYNNLKNEYPQYFEYPLILDLYDKNKMYVGYWGLLSAKFEEKTSIKPSMFMKMILENPGYDVYHINPYKYYNNLYNNTFTQGELESCHPGICEYINKLFKILGYENFDINDIKFDPKHFSYCSYYIGNQKFWERWITFSSFCIEISRKDSNLNYLDSKLINQFPGNDRLINFPYIVERLVGLFFYLYDSEIKIKAF
jgi:hypothetical protein